MRATFAATCKFDVVACKLKFDFRISLGVAEIRTHAVHGTSMTDCNAECGVRRVTCVQLSLEVRCCCMQVEARCLDLGRCTEVGV